MFFKKGNYDFDKTAFSNKIIWTLPRNRNESEIEYFGCAVAFCSNLKYFSMYKTILYYQSNDLDVSLSQYFQFC